MCAMHNMSKMAPSVHKLEVHHHSDPFKFISLIHSKIYLEL